MSNEQDVDLRKRVLAFVKSTRGILMRYQFLETKDKKMRIENVSSSLKLHDKRNPVYKRKRGRTAPLLVYITNGDDIGQHK